MMKTRRLYPVFNLSEDLEQLQRQLERAFDPAPVDRSEFSAVPLELSETPEAYRLRALIPGLHPEQVSVSAEGKTLTIEGVWRPQELDKDETVHLQEFRYGKFRRSISFTTPIDADGIEAHYAHGILSLRVPKQETAQRKTIPINIG